MTGLKKCSHGFEHTQVNKDFHLFIFAPKYKLRAKQNVIHDSFGQRSIRHGVCVHGEVLHQIMMIVAAGKARLMPPELTPRVHLSNSQSNRSPMTDVVKRDLPDAHRDVLKTIHPQIS